MCDCVQQQLVVTAVFSAALIQTIKRRARFASQVGKWKVESVSVSRFSPYCIYNHTIKLQELLSILRSFLLLHSHFGSSQI